MGSDASKDQRNQNDTGVQRAGSVQDDPQKQAGAGASAGFVGATALSRTGDVSKIDDEGKTKDQGLDAGQSYGHGAFMGAAGAFMQDAMWNSIFAAVWPEEHKRITEIKDLHTMILQLENNPVLAAYGECKTLEAKGEKKGDANPQSGKVVPQEWDVWIDPIEPGNLSKCKIAHGNLQTTILQNLPGGFKDTAIGYNRADVKAAKSAPQWMELFGKAVMMYRGGASVPDDKAKDRMDAMQKSLSATTADQAISLCAEFLNKKNGGGLILDVKSTYSKPQDINTFIDSLKSKGIDVWGVGTFRHTQLDGIEDGVRRVKFFHGLQGVKNAADNKELKSGDHLMFNAGSLLDQSGGWIRELKFGVNQSSLQELITIQKTYDLNIGLYVQEGDIDPKAVEVIVKLFNRMPWLFRDGFAYGNISGKAEQSTVGRGMGAQEKANKIDQLNQKVF
jgi:hypothetical protein